MKKITLSNTKNRPRLTLVTTVPDTMAVILAEQPRYLSKFFDLSLITSNGNFLPHIRTQEDIPVDVVPMNRGIHPLKDIISIWHMATTLRRLRPHLIHSYTPKAGLVSMLAAWLCCIPVRVHTFTGLIFPTSKGFKKQVLILVDRLICACATHIVPEGEGVRQDLQKYGITNKPLNVIGHGNIAGVDTRHFNPDDKKVWSASKDLKEWLTIEADSMVFCFIGRLNQDKGISELYQAFNSLSSQAHLVLVGELDSSSPIPNELQNALKSHPRVHSLGFMKDIRPALRLADVLVLPSYREGFPNVVLQAGAMGLPVIATDINGCNEIIESGLNGWLVPARDSLALQKAMHNSMLKPKSERISMGKRARERIQERFERTEHWLRMKNFYNELLFKHSLDFSEAPCSKNENP